MFVDEKGKFIFDIKKTFDEVLEFKKYKNVFNKNDEVDDIERKGDIKGNSKLENKLDNKLDNKEGEEKEEEKEENDTEAKAITLFTESEIQLINCLNTDYNIKIFTCTNKIEQDYVTNWNQLITLTLKNTDTEMKIEHIERWLIHFSRG